MGGGWHMIYILKLNWRGLMILKPDMSKLGLFSFLNLIMTVIIGTNILKQTHKPKAILLNTVGAAHMIINLSD